jgi:hypothetical protein
MKPKPKDNKMARQRGNPGRGKNSFVREQMDKFAPVWWEILLAMLEGESKEDRRFALAELNKLQIKTLPTEVSGLDGAPIEIKWKK